MKGTDRVQHVLRFRRANGWVAEFTYDESSDEMEYRLTRSDGMVEAVEHASLDDFAKAIHRNRTREKP